MPSLTNDQYRIGKGYALEILHALNTGNKDEYAHLVDLVAQSPHAARGAIETLSTIVVSHFRNLTGTHD